MAAFLSPPRQAGPCNRVTAAGVPLFSTAYDTLQRLNVAADLADREIGARSLVRLALSSLLAGFEE